MDCSWASLGAVASRCGQLVSDARSLILDSSLISETGNGEGDLDLGSLDTARRWFCCSGTSRLAPLPPPSPLLSGGRGGGFQDGGGGSLADMIFMVQQGRNLLKGKLLFYGTDHQLKISFCSKIFFLFKNVILRAALLTTQCFSLLFLTHTG